LGALDEGGFIHATIVRRCIDQASRRIQADVNVIARLWIGSHQWTAGQLSDYLDGELRGLRRRRVLAHLSSCDRCRTVLGSLERAVEALRSLGQAEPLPGSSVDVVLARIRAERGGA
jgi:anti-sigma factor RsiW